MEIIAHRCNTLAKLVATDSTYGVEIDLRSQSSNLILQHDPCVQGELFSHWLDAYKHGTIILNVKEEGLEEIILQELQERKIHDFFFLDQSFPFLIKWANLGEKRCSIRVSEYECIQTALSLSGKIDWVWVDCFTKMPLSIEDYNTLKKSGYKLCLVSPELQGRASDIQAMIKLIKSMGLSFDAVCTKHPEVWDNAQLTI